MGDATAPTPSPPSSAATLAAHRFGAAALGHPGTPVRPLPDPSQPRTPPWRWRLAHLATAAVPLLMAAAFLLGGWLADRGERTVWQVVRPVPAGKAITAADLRQATVTGGVADGALPADRTPAGQVARVPIPAGALLTPVVITTGPTLPGPGGALVGVALAPGNAPADGLAVGDLVRVVRVPVTEEEAKVRPAGTPVLPAAATVWAVGPGKQAATTVTLQVPIPSADLIAGLGARGAIALERVGPPG